MQLTANTYFTDVLSIFNEKRAAIALDMAELRSEGVSVIDVDPGDLLALELAGFMVCIETGRILAGPAQLVL